MKLYGLKEVIPEGTYIVYDLHMCPYMHVAICMPNQLHFNIFSGLEPQIVSHTVEVTTCYLIAKQDPQEFSHLVSGQHIKSLK